jgi:hypothetical protein
MGRRGPLLAPAVALLALLALPGAGAAEERSKCQKLRGKDLAPAKKVKLVRRKNDEGGNDLRGCVLPRGGVIKVASSSDAFTSQSSYDIGQVAGHHVLIDSSSASQYGGYADTYVVDLKRRRSYTVASFCREGVGGFCNPDVPNETAVRTIVNSGGRAVAMIKTAASNRVKVRGYTATGKPIPLDSGPAADVPVDSLELDGNVASWVNSGERRSAPLRRSECQRLRAKGRDLAGAKRVKLVRRANADGGTDLIGCVLPRGNVTTVASSAKIPGSERRYRKLQVAGHHVLVRGEVTNQYGHGVSTYVYDLKEATSYNLAETCFDDQGVACEPQTRAPRAFVNGAGQAAAVVRTQGSDEVRVIGFTTTGARRILDAGTAAEIPASSLSLEGHVVRWRHSGAPKSATLSG